ncbi:hypothetical protein [Flavobacterium suncheonense]|uniref:Uncharacterized protein n=1 Tax=Flavobacterium suncheonense GH29-5 = DSM 17707 TaxID=1121899 RepID=A0A0A2MAY4_9FLAO|nr:hypothetical protein [Flavobacterium suncheonense]KGO85450.1 hypothetical protein Q764_14090 [Flavobacterium suncheonense GH29-5 = DSM 17707]
MGKIKFIFFLFLLQNTILAQTIDLSDFVIDSIQLDKRIYPSGNIRKSWQLYDENSIIKVKELRQWMSRGDSIPYSKDFLSKKFELTAGKRTVKKVDNGYLIAYNHGEFRSALYYLSFDGQQSYNITPANIRINDFFEFNSKLYAIEGINHLGGEQGSLIEIYLDKNVWNYRLILNFDEEPEKVFRRGKETFIITTNYILKLEPNFRLSKFIKSPFRWGIFGPNSAFIIKKDLYIGMNGGILKIENFEKKLRYIWYNHK